MHAAVDSASGEMVGHAMLSLRPDHGIGLISRVLVAPQRRGRGVGQALMQELTRIGFDELGLHRLQLGVYDFNAAAIALYQSLGFSIEGRLRDSTKSSNGYWSSYVMALLASDYRRAVPARATRVREARAREARVREARVREAGVREARVRDAPAVASLLTQLGYAHDESQASERIASWAGDPFGCVLIAVDEATPVGLLAVRVVRYFEREGSFARVLALAVDELHRRRGIGRALLDRAEAWARERGCTDIEVASHRDRADAQAFYAAHGYEDVCNRSARFKRSLR